jgi:hypothetical protein
MIILGFLALNDTHNWAYSNFEASSVDVYSQFIKMWAASIYHFHPKSIVNIRAVNFSTELTNDIIKKHPYCTFTSNSYPFTLRTKEWYKGYVVTAKVKHIIDCLRLYKQPVIFIDNDCLLRSNLKGLLDISHNADLAYSFHPNQADDHKINAGVMVFKYTEACLLVLETWYSLMTSMPIHKIMPQKFNGRCFSGEQYQLYQATNLINHTSVHLPYIYNDGLLRKESIIWHGNKGSKLEALEKLKTEWSNIKNAKKRN